MKNSYDWVRAWRYVIVQPSVKNVGFAAASFSNRRGLQVFPGVKRLTAVTGYSKRAVVDALAVMRELGFLWRVTSAQGSNRGLADSYQLCLPRSMEHVPMVDAKTGKDPVFAELPALAQRTALVLGVATRLRKGSGYLSSPGGDVSSPLVDTSGNQEWWSQITPPSHVTYGSTKSSDNHHAASHEADRRASSSARDFDFDDLDDCYEYIEEAVGGDLNPYEAAAAYGMLSKAEPPAAIVNALLAWRARAA